MLAIKRKIGIAIVDNDESIRSGLEDKISATEYATILFSVGVGSNVAELIIEYEPDILVLDEMLPYKSGLFVLEEIESIEVKPYIIYTSSVYNSEIISRAIVHGINDFLVKPYDLQDLVNRLKYLSEVGNTTDSYGLYNDEFELHERIQGYKSQNKIEYRYMIQKRIDKTVSVILNNSGFNCSLTGYGYIVDAVKEIIKYRENQYSIVNDIYSAVASLHSIAANTVECSIRRCINNAWVKHQAHSDEFSSILNIFNERPSNLELLKALTLEVCRNIDED